PADRDFPEYALPPGRPEVRPCGRVGLWRPMPALTCPRRTDDLRGIDRKAMDHRDARAAGRPVPAILRRLRFYARIRDLPIVCGRSRAAHLWRHVRDHAGADLTQPLMAAVAQGTMRINSSLAIRAPSRR